MTTKIGIRMEKIQEIMAMKPVADEETCVELNEEHVPELNEWRQRLFSVICPISY